VEELSTWWALGPGAFAAHMGSEGKAEQMLGLLNSVPAQEREKFRDGEWEAFLSQHLTREAMLLVLRNPGLPADIMLSVSRSTDEGTLMKVTLNPALPSTELVRLTRGTPSWRLLRNIAHHPNADEETFMCIFSPRTLTRFPVAAHTDLIRIATSNRNFPSSLLEKYATQRDPVVIRNAAKHQHSTALVFLNVAQYGNTQAKIFAAGNSSCPAEVLHMLASDPDEQVRTAAVRALDLLHYR
jgi:hypothetical protein